MIKDNLEKIKKLIPKNVSLVVVSKTHPSSAILEAYQTGHRIFGENKVQELVEKYENLPKDIEWHMIGHLQSNKVKYIAPFVALIHGVDSLNLLEEINKRAAQNNRIISCLLQIHVAKEESKFGFSENELTELLSNQSVSNLKNIKLVGLMGMATNTNKINQIRSEFQKLKFLFENIKNQNSNFKILSMGMSGDYQIAIEEGSNMVRIGSSIFGNRNYTKN